jgi:hypothetical protein
MGSQQDAKAMEDAVAVDVTGLMYLIGWPIFPWVIA